MIQRLAEWSQCYKQENLAQGFWLKNISRNCLPLIWKLLSGVIADQIYGHLDQKELLPEEQKGWKKRSRGTNDLLYVDRTVIREVKSRKKNLAIAWIDYKKVYDMVPHSWIKKCLDLFRVAENIKTL